MSLLWIVLVAFSVLYVLNDIDQLVTRSYPYGFVTFWDLVTSLAIVLKQRGIAGELQQICYTILRMVYFGPNYHDCVNILSNHYFFSNNSFQQVLWELETSNNGTPATVQTCQFKHWTPGNIFVWVLFSTLRVWLIFKG
jgi:hypothetical protein